MDIYTGFNSTNGSISRNIILIQTSVVVSFNSTNGSISRDDDDGYEIFISVSIPRMVRLVDDCSTVPVTQGVAFQFHEWFD